MRVSNAIRAVTCLAALAAPVGAADDDLMARALAILADTPLIDGHNDTPYQYRKRVNNHVAELAFETDLSGLDAPMHTDLPRLRAGRVGGQFWSVYIPIRRFGGAAGDARLQLEQIDLARRLIERYPDDLELALTADDIVRIHGAGRIASLLGMEGGQSIEDSLAVLRATYALGVRYMTITHSISETWADSATDETRVDGLSAFGREVVREMNRLGMMVDLSHVSPKTMHDALDIVEAPIIFSHSSARALCDHPRNVPDDVLTRVRDNGGVVMVTFVPSYICEDLRRHEEQADAQRKELARLHPDDLDAIGAAMRAWHEANPAPACTLNDVADHIDHVRRIAGIDHVGIGSDYDGIRNLPVGLEDVSKYPDLVVELLRRGYRDDEVRKVIGINVLRVMRANERIARRLQGERAASDATIEELDGVSGG